MSPAPLPEIPVTIRSFEPRDAEVCRTLYHQGLIGGTLAENDTGLDIDDIPLAYLEDGGNHFWVAENPAGEVVGMIGVQRHDRSVGEIRRLRVRADHRRRGIGSRLLETAIRFCNERGYVQVQLDTFIEREPAIRLFEKFQFRLTRTRLVQGRELLYFYLDIYNSGQTRQG